jgi:hypothetical protein
VKKFPLVIRSVIALGLSSCILGFLLSSALFAGFIMDRYSMVVDNNDSVGDCFTAVAAGGDHSIIGWGDNSNGQATPPDGNDFIAVAAGGYHSLAFKSDHSIVGWSSNYYCQATPPAENNFIAIVARGYHAIVLKFDGTIAGWGENDCGQAASLAGNNFIDITAGGAHSFAPRYSFALSGDLGDTGSVEIWDLNVFADKWLSSYDFSDFASLAGNRLVDCYADPNNPACVSR